jgi:hypothetical protein
MTKRVAWFTGKASSGAVTPYKVYDVFNEDGDSFNLKDDKGGTRLCLKKGCAHICHKDWVLADVVEQTEKQEIVEEDIVTTKQPKWGEWIKSTTGKCPDGLKRKQKIKLKWSDGDKFVIDNPHDAAWYFSQGAYPVDITHYKVKLKDVSSDIPKAQDKQKSKWTKNIGVCPVPPNTRVEVVLQNGETLYGEFFNWGDTPMKGRKIVKWRLAD